MNPIVINLMKFMSRVDLKWNEVPAYNECMVYLQELDKQNIDKELDKKEKNV